MKHLLVKILSSDDGIKRKKTVWCLDDYEAATHRTFCEGEAYGIGDSGCEFENKYHLKKGDITCPRCIDKIKKIQLIKL